MKIDIRHFALGGISIQTLRHGDTFVDSDGKPVPDLLIIHKGFIQFTRMDGRDYVIITKIPQGCDSPTYLLMLRDDMVTISNYMNATAGTEGTDEKNAE